MLLDPGLRCLLTEGDGGGNISGHLQQAIGGVTAEQVWVGNISFYDSR